MLGVSQSRGLKLFGREIIFEEFQPMCSRYLIVTDGQTDGRLTVASPRSALASRGKNETTMRIVNWNWPVAEISCHNAVKCMGVEGQLRLENH